MTLRSLAVAVAAVAVLFSGWTVQSAELKPWAGGPTPALSLKDLEGAAHTLATYRGKVVILNFWATWCEPCRDEMASFNKLRQSLEGKPVVMFAVNIGEGEGRIAEFLRKVPVEFPVLLDRDAKASRDWKVRLMPTTFIIGTDGRVRYSYAGERDWAGDSVRATIAALAEERVKR